MAWTVIAKFLQPALSGDDLLWLVSMGQTKLGIHPRQGWLLQSSGGLMLVDSPSACMPMLPLLEVDRSAFDAHLRSVQLRYPQFDRAIHDFPHEFLLRFALTQSVSDYWPGKALDWLRGDERTKRLLVSDISGLYDKGWASQSLKQKAKRALAN